MSAGVAETQAAARARARIASVRGVRERPACYEDGRHGAAVPAGRPMTVGADGSSHEAMPGSSQLSHHSSGPAGTRRRADQVLSAAQNRLEPTAAGRVWRQLSELGFINNSPQFAAAFTLGFIPFLMVLSAALGPGLTRAIATRNGFSSPAARDLAMLFSHARAASASLTVLALVLAVLGGDAIARMVQAWYAKIFRAHIRGWKAIARRAQWLAGVFGYLALQAVIGRKIQPHSGDIAAASAQFLLALAFWWWSLHALLAGQIPWRRLFRAGLATAICYTGLGAYITYVMSSSIVSSQATYGPIGAVITLLAAQTGLAVALQLGAAIGATIGRRKTPAATAPADPGRQTAKDRHHGLAPATRRCPPADIGRVPR